MRILIPLLLCLSACSSAPKKSNSQGPVEVKIHSPKKGVLQLNGRQDSCFVDWVFKKGRLTVSNHQCRRPLKDTIEIMDKMLVVLKDWVKDYRKIKTLYFNVNHYPSIEERLGFFAYLNEGWNSQRGRAKGKQTIEEMLKGHFNNKNPFPLIKSIWSNQCFDLKVKKISHIKVRPANTLPYYANLRIRKVSRYARLPVMYNVLLDVKLKHLNCLPQFEKQSEK